MNATNMKEQKKFRDMSVEERVDFLVKSANLPEGSAGVLKDRQGGKAAEGENFLAFARMPVGIVPQVIVNGKSYIVPLITEEPSVVAAASRGSKMTEGHGGFFASVKGTTTLGQVQITEVPQPEIGKAIDDIEKAAAVLISLANNMTPHLVAEGGGVLSIKPKMIETRSGPQIIVDFEAECKDSMGANAVSKMAEGMAPELERITHGKVIGRILSNLSLGRLVVCEATFDKDMLSLRKDIAGKPVDISGDEMIDRIVALSAWADADQFRATTHNKGIMNGITSVALATGQDTRAIESAAHSYAAFGKGYAPLSVFEKDGNGNLHGRLEVPIPVGTIGGTIKTNDIIRVCLEITECKTPSELAALIGAVGLAQNVSALRMLAGEGITSGHLPLHMKRTGT